MGANKCNSTPPTMIERSIVDIDNLHNRYSSHPKLRLLIILVIQTSTETPPLNYAQSSSYFLHLFLSHKLSTLLSVDNWNSSWHEQLSSNICSYSSRTLTITNFIHKIGCSIRRPKLTRAQNHPVPAHETYVLPMPDSTSIEPSNSFRKKLWKRRGGKKRIWRLLPLTIAFLAKYCPNCSQ